MKKKVKKHILRLTVEGLAKITCPFCKKKINLLTFPLDGRDKSVSWYKLPKKSKKGQSSSKLPLNPQGLEEKIIS